MSEISARIYSGFRLDAGFFRLGSGSFWVEAVTTAFPAVVTAAKGVALRRSGYWISAHFIHLGVFFLFLAEGLDGAVGFGFHFVFFLFEVFVVVDRSK
jgi:hypothetical protein